MDKTKLLNLSISTRIISQLGEQLISDELVALMELIKNAYDADATKVTIKVDTKAETSHGIGMIEIEDNGNGMTPSIIENSFLRISTGFKEEYKISPYFKRLVLGKKGLGRLAFNRLGKYINVYTTPRVDRISDELVGNLEGFNEFKLFVDWESLYVDQDFNKIQATLERHINPEPTYGTKIQILGIKNTNFWKLDKTQRQRLKNEIFGMINPFTKNKESRFEIYLYIDGEKFTTEELDEDLIRKISDVSANFNLNSNWILSLDINRKEKYINNRIVSTKKNRENASTKLVLQEKNIDPKIYNIHYEIDLKNSKEIRSILPKVGDITFSTKNNELCFPGILSGAIYATDLGNKKEIIKNLNADNIKTNSDFDNLWEQANGIFVFRNEFRILPYGKNDWLDFTKMSQRLKSNIYKEHTIAGYINLDGETSENLEEQTNRQGFIEDEYGNNFFKIIKDIIAVTLVNEDIKLRDGFDLKTKEEKGFLYSKNNMIKYKMEISQEKQKENKKEELKISINNLKANTSNIAEIENISHITDEFFKLDSKVEKKNEQEMEILQRQIDEIKEIAPMVGQAIIIESMTHELNRIEGNIKQYSKNSLDIAYELDDTFNGKNKLINNQHSIIDETVFMRAQLNHLEPTYRSQKNTMENIDIKKLLEESYKTDGPMAIKAKNSNIDVQISGKNFTIKANRGYIITIFDNLFLNSLHWINYEEVNKKEILIHIDEKGYIYFWDTGNGIHPDIEDSLFNPFTTMKKNGRGLGLYIVTELLSQMNSTIELDEDRKNGRLYKFKINLSNLLED